MIVEIPEGTDIANMPIELQKLIASVGGEFPEGIMIGTEPVDSKQLLLINVNATKIEVEAMTGQNAFDDEGNQIAFDLDWSVLAVENEVVDQSALLPYFKDTPKGRIDDSGDYVVDYVPTTDLTNILQVWSGKKWLYA